MADERSPRMVREIAALDEAWTHAAARALDAARSQRVLSALRWMVAAPDILTKMGYALVPLEPTEVMLRAAWGSLPGAADMVIAAAYRAMVAAAAETDDPA